MKFSEYEAEKRIGLPSSGAHQRPNPEPSAAESESIRLDSTPLKSNGPDPIALGLEQWAARHQLTPEHLAGLRRGAMKMNMWPGVALTLTSLGTVLLGPLYGHDVIVVFAALSVGLVGAMHVFSNIHHNP